MAKLLLYLLESSAVLAFLYLLYLLAMRKETFFTLNRIFLLGILTFSLLFPLVRFDFQQAGVAALNRPIEEVGRLRLSYYEAMAEWEFSSYGKAPAAGLPDTSAGTSFRGFSWLPFTVALIFAVYAIGVVFCLSRTVWSIRWIYQLIASNPRHERDGIKVIGLPYPMAPFSFLNYVFVQQAIIGTEEFDKIVEHEKIHVRQRHSLDLIFVQLLAAFFWFNPVIWQLIKSLKTTHEYIADKKIIDSGYSMVEYQTLLLKQLISNNSFGLVHNFNLSFIKKRITMMKNKSGWPGKVRVAVAVAISVLFTGLVVQCNSTFEEQTAPGTDLITDADFTQGINLPVVFDNGYVFDGRKDEALNVSIKNSKLTIDGKACEISNITELIAKSNLSHEASLIVMRVDKDQLMGFVRDVHTELRKANRRKILYMGLKPGGSAFEIPFLLPPMPEDAAKLGVPVQPELNELEAEGKMEILRIRLGDNAGAANQQLVYEFVQSHMKAQSSEYVVSAGFSNEDTYSDYLVNLAYIYEAFNQIYQERSQEMFGKDFYEIASNNREQYDAVRKGVPRAISIAEK